MSYNTAYKENDKSFCPGKSCVHLDLGKKKIKSKIISFEYRLIFQID